MSVGKNYSGGELDKDGIKNRRRECTVRAQTARAAEVEEVAELLEWLLKTLTRKNRG